MTAESSVAGAFVWPLSRSLSSNGYLLVAPLCLCFIITLGTSWILRAATGFTKLISDTVSTSPVRVFLS